MLQNIIIFVKDPTQSLYMGLLYTLGLFLSNIFQSLFTHHWYYNGLYVGMKVEISMKFLSHKIEPCGSWKYHLSEIIQVEC